ncbi:MAG: lipid-A-disaccharide synthase, partial [Halobacteriovoraceae bacterium]|nr:lipid-A-disaccharide synthase [Halobacteriovoraceae bacterium]
TDLGFESLYQLKDFSSWGFSEVIAKIPFYFSALNKIVETAVERNTKVAILIDFQDFNLRLAKRLSKNGIKVLYYVAPQAWAWKPWRAKTLGEAVHTLFTIIPFEKNWFKERGVRNVVSVNHPLHYSMGPEFKKGPSKIFAELKDACHLLLLPGSRNFEVKNLLPEFIKVAAKLKNENPGLRLSIVKSPNVDEALYSPYLQLFEKIYPSDSLTNALEQADFSLAASGTVTLATALYEVPTVVCYKSSLLNEFIFYTFLDYKGPISLANIVHDRIIYPELIQDQATEYNIHQAILKWMTSEAEYIKIKKELAKTKELIRGEGLEASQILAEVINQNSI